MDNKTKRLKILKKSLMVLMIVFVISFASFIDFDKIENNIKLNAVSRTYSPSIYEIASSDITVGNYIEMSRLYTQNGATITAIDNGVSTANVILISTALDLYAFSQLANTEDSPFLEYNYQLASNIDYDDCNYPFVPIAWNSTYHNRFTGSFDGNGFEIVNLEMIQITDDIGDSYSSMEYYSMFSYNAGTITNLGIINASLVTNTSRLSSLLGVAPLVGLNSGTISYCYAKDLRDPVTDEEAGIVTAGGFQISGLVSNNEGRFTDCYVAYSIVCNYSIQDYIDFSEMLTISSNGAVNERLYFYNGTIDSYVLSGTTETITYDTNLVGVTLTKNYYGALYIDNIPELTSRVVADDVNNKWFDEAHYSGCTTRVRSSFSIDTPILRGLEYTIEQDVTVFYIDKIRDFLYFFELINNNAVFASNGCKYILRADIDLSSISQNLYEYTGAFNAVLEGVEIADANKTIIVTDIRNTSSKYPTIYNAKIDNTTVVEGTECYGFIPWLTGTIKNINFYYEQTIDYIKYTNNISKKAIGLVAGYVEGGTLENINVYGNISVINDIGKYCMGGIAGVITDRGTVTKSTAAGSINAGSNQTTYADFNETGYLNGNCLGGIVGYTTYTTGDFSEVLSAVNLTAATYSTGVNILYQHIGGVIGAGYTQRAVDLTNKGTIVVGSSTNSNYGSGYIAGVIGRHLGVNSQVEVFYNQGDITIYGNNSSSYVSGVSNVELVSNSSTLQLSRLKNSSGRIAYFASSLTNAATFNIYNGNNNISVSGVLNINSSRNNNFVSEISGVYNLGYKFNVQDKVRITETQTIDMSGVNKYTACITTTGESTENQISLEKVYNLRDIVFTTSSDITANELVYSGAVLGKYINYSDVRNEGNLTFTTSNQIGTATTETLIRIAGVFEEVTSGYKADKIFNGGDINFTASAFVYGDLYVNGICNYNRNGFSDSQISTYDPTTSSFNDSNEGSLNQAINNGDITCTNSSFTAVTYAQSVRYSANNQQQIASVWNVSNAATSYFVGDINASGITYINESVITNTFNLGDVLTANFISDTSTEELSINASGISTLNIGKYAYILNCANNGTIRSMNLSNSTFSNVNASGISVRNDKLSDGSDYTGGASHSAQMICFTINYGSIYSYNYCENIRSSSDEARTKSAGILTMGLCNVINTVNYGNIYGSETGSGIFGIIYFSNFSTEVSNTNQIYISNSINYGNVRVLEKGTNYFADRTCVNILYRKFITLSDTDSDIDNYAKIEINLEEGKNYFIGSIFSIVNFNNDANANYVLIRFLISFLEDIQIVGAEAATPASVTIDTNNIYSAYYKFANNVANYDYYMGKRVVYSPLSTGNQNGFEGVFSDQFAFRKAIETGEGLSTDNVTDKFISDHFQFVAYTKINDNLLDKIGWRAIAYYTAANDFAQSLSSLMVFLDTYKNKTGNDYANLVTSALNISTWTQYCSQEMLADLVSELLLSYDFDSTRLLLEYLFSPECANSLLITNSIRAEIIDLVLASDSNIFSVVNFITYENGYSSLLADILSVGTENEVKQYIIDYFTNNNFSNDDLRIILQQYIEHLRTNPTYFNSVSSLDRYDILNNLFSAIDDEVFYEGLILLLSNESQTIINSLNSSNDVTQYAPYGAMTSGEKVEFYRNILINSDVDKVETYLTEMANEISLFVTLKSKGYDISSFEDINTLALIDTISSDELIITERVALYNQIRNTQAFKNYLSSVISTPYYAKATEHRNTFQSTTAPAATDGSYSGQLTYAYSSQVTPSTYFYGPYADNLGALHSIISDNNFKNYSTVLDVSRTGSPKYYTPLFLTQDLDLIDYYYSQGLVNQYYTFYYEYGSTGANNQLAGADIIDVRYNYYQGNITDFSGCQLVNEDIYLIDNTGEEFNINGGTISGYTRNLTDNINSYFITDSNNRVHYFNGEFAAWSSTVASYGIKYYAAIPTTELHPTQLNGIIYFAAPWQSHAFYFTWKNAFGNNRDRVYTTQYIDYTIDDLSLLDGVLTGYDNITNSSDERAIINELINTCISNDSEYFKKVLKQALLESLAYNSDNTINSSYIDEFMKTNIGSQTKINNTSPFEYLNYNSTTNVKDYLLSLAATANYKEKLIYGASLDSNVYIDLIETIVEDGTPPSYDYTSNITEEEFSRLENSNLVSQFMLDDNVDLSEYYGTNVISVANPATYNGHTYNYGLNFSEIGITNIATDATTLRFLGKSTAADATLTVSTINGEEVGSFTFATIGELSSFMIDISLSTETSFVLSSNNDIVIYKVDYENIYSGTYLHQLSIANATTRTTPIPTEDEFKTMIINSLTGVPVTSDNMRLDSVNVRTTIFNGYGSQQVMSLYAGTTRISYETVASRTLVELSGDITAYCGQDLGARLGTNTVENTSIYFSNPSTIDYTVDYNYSIFTAIDLLTNENIIRNRLLKFTPTYTSVILMNAYEQSKNTIYSNSFLIGNISYFMPYEFTTSTTNSIITSVDFLRLVATFSNDNILLLLDTIADENLLNETLLLLVQDNYRFFTSIIERESSNLTDEYKELLLAAYIATDYLRVYNQSLTNSSINVSQTTMYSLLNVFDSDKKYINANGTFNNDYFDNLLSEIGLSLATSGYGIYALSSSKGILNGQFIPDNFGLSGMDTNYDYDASGFITLTDDNDNLAYWRGGSSSTTCTTGSVSDGFLNDMKQLKLSISTTVFELELIDDTASEIIYSSGELIDLDNNTITFYIPNAYAGKTFVYNYSSIANGARIDTTNFAITAVGNGSATGTILITAEDPTIVQEYTVIITCIDMDYNISLSGSPVSPSGGTLTLAVSQGSTGRLPEGLNIAPYISIKNAALESLNDTFTITSSAIIDANGNTEITLLINTRLRAGDYSVYVSLFGIDILEKSVAFTKEPSTECDITNFEYEGYRLDFTLSSENIYEATSEIDFGRCFTENELVSTNYLTYISYSDCSDVVVSATFAIDPVTSITTYTITYVVTAENGNTHTYRHYLVERTPNTTPTVFKDGMIVANSYNEYNQVDVNFNRGEEPSYRIKYNLNNFYMDSNNIEYRYELGSTTLTEGLTISSTFAGIVVDINSLAEPGRYEFYYVYANSVHWNDSTVLSSEYRFPLIAINKNYSQDALLKTITFLDTNVVLSNLRTVIYPDYAIISNTAEASSYDNENEKDYYDIRSNATPLIEVDVKSINYSNTGVDYSNSDNFYAIGSVADAQLAAYTPTFSIEEHAQMYQYTTLRKLQTYGLNNNQAVFDTECLNTNGTEDLYLYVPFVDINGIEYIFVVQVVDGVWTNVYEEDFRGTVDDISIATYDNLTSSFTYNEITYTKAPYAGIADANINNSLNSDYIGSPLINHFWYVSYVIFSEDYIMNHSDASTAKFFHVAIVDATNTIFFRVKINVPGELNVTDVYLLIVDREYLFSESPVVFDKTEYISAFAVQNGSTNGNGDNVFELTTDLQVVPRGYFYFYLDLPEGYACTYKITNNKANNNDNSQDEVGGYLPPPSLVTQRVEIEFTIYRVETGVVWGVSTAGVYGIMATEDKS